MKTIRILSWNVNGIRAIAKKGFLDWLAKDKPDILCLQETKAHEEQLSAELTKITPYRVFFSSAGKKGYSGVAIYTKKEPAGVKKGLGVKKFDSEGRTLIADYGSFILYNIYFPNGKASSARLKYKMDFYDGFLRHAEKLRKKGKSLVVCGDINTAHREIDLARPKQNETVSGFLPEERAWIDKFLGRGYIDTLRMFNKDPGQYTWWDYKSGARKRNVGWRLDYFFVSESFEKKVKSAFILSKVMGSDHCPIGIEVAP
ncbi:MAG: exodeoxyribonuclease III [Pseudomonadota bacterium]